MNLHIISGSNRNNSQSSRISNLISKECIDQFNVSVDLLDLSKDEIPLWSEDGFGSFATRWKEISDSLNRSDCYIFVVPEWHGMAPPHLKNLILCSGSEIFFHKPALIITVSSGMGGTYPAAELRISSQKNSHICWIPEQVIIRNVNKWDIKNKDEIYERLIISIKVLLKYSESLKSIRSFLKSENKFKFGM